MKIQIDVVGRHPEPDVTWPEGWPVPPEGAMVSVKGDMLWVRSVTWYPNGEDDDDHEPFIYVVLGPRRPD